MLPNHQLSLSTLIHLRILQSSLILLIVKVNPSKLRYHQYSRFLLYLFPYRNLFFAYKFCNILGTNIFRNRALNRYFLEFISQDRCDMHRIYLYFPNDIIQKTNLTPFKNCFQLSKNIICLRHYFLNLIRRELFRQYLNILRDIINPQLEYVEELFILGRQLPRLRAKHLLFSITILQFALITLNQSYTVIFMNQPISIKERRQSTSRLSVISNIQKSNLSTSDLKRKGTSLNKKYAEIEELCPNKLEGKYLVGWGRIPFLHEQSNKVQVINKDIIEFGCGEDHLVFVNFKNQAFGIGKNQYGQLGNSQNIRNKDVITPVFQKFKITKIFCTEFSTFFVTDSGQLYGCGLNNRGQLGISSKEQKVTVPQLIYKLSEQAGKENLGKKQSHSKISSVYNQQLKKTISEYQFSQKCAGKTILEPYEEVIDIKGGPFHTVALTSKGRIFYTGNLYKSQSIIQDQYTRQFIELNTSKFGKIVSIKSFLTGFFFMNHQKKLFVLGIFGVHILNEPEPIESVRAISYDINEQGLYVVNDSGELLFFGSDRRYIKNQRIALNQEVKNVFCGMDYVIAITKENKVFGKGDNTYNQLCKSNVGVCNQMVSLDINFKQQQHVFLKCNNNFVLVRVNKPLQIDSANKDHQSSKLKDLQRQNKILKEMLSNKSKKNVKIQTDRQSKFDFPKVINARTFEGSMQIPFQEIKLGKQISQGGYGVIYKATWRKSLVAVKLFKIQQQNDAAIRDFISQCHAMEALRHPNIVMFLGACTKPPHFAIVLEYCDGGTLWTLLQKHQELTWQQRRNFALDIAKGMNYLHDRPTPILHRDLKSLNLLLDSNRRIKLADFGWTKGLQNYMTGKIGTYQWMAPQVISAFQYTEKADIFSFGIILWEIASREAPYRNIPGPQVAQDVANKDLRPVVPKKTPQAFAALMRRCWDKNANSRPSFSVLITELEEMQFG